MSCESEARPTGVQPMVEQIADHLRHAILRGDLKPGAPVKERDNAARLGVSRTPMREAIRILAQEGLLELRPARSPIVADPEPATLIEQSQVLMALEMLSAELACGAATDVQLRDIADKAAAVAGLSAGGAGSEAGDPIEVFEADMAFHTAIVAASGNKTLVDMHGDMLRLLWRARFQAASRQVNRRRATQEHDAIAAALLARAPDRAQAAIRVHLVGIIDEFSAL